MKFQVQFGGLYLLDHIRPQCGPVLRLRVPPSSLTEPVRSNGCEGKVCRVTPLISIITNNWPSLFT